MNVTRLARIVGLTPSLLLLVASGCYFGPQTKGSGISKTEMRTVGDFVEIEISGIVNLDLTQGPATSLEVTTDDNVLPVVLTEVSGGRLKIHTRGGVTTDLGIKVKATTPALASFEGSGATTATLTGIRARELRLTLSGASTATATGSVEQLSAHCSGASRLHATKLAAGSVDASASGASTVEVEALQRLKADASGASTISYVGKPAELQGNASGASKLVPK